MAHSKSNASAEQPGKTHLALAHLSKASAKTGGTWDVYMWRVFEDTYDYQFQGKPRQGTNFICTLISAARPEWTLRHSGFFLVICFLGSLLRTAAFSSAERPGC